MKNRVMWIKTLATLSLSSGLGLLAGGFVVTLLVALANYRAQDGPIFPAPLVAFAVVAPVSSILFTFQGFVLIYEWAARRRLGNSLLWIGAGGGLAAGLIPYGLAIAPYQSNSDYRMLLAFSGLGIFLGLVVFGCHRIANLLKVSATGWPAARPPERKGWEC
jgi:hypothetical protein